MDTTGTIRRVLSKEGRLAGVAEQLDEADDLYKRGLTSHASVAVMLALEESFGVEFPDSMLRKRTFESISSIRSALSTLGVAGAEPERG